MFPERNKLKTENTNLKKCLQNLDYQAKTAESLTQQIFRVEEKVKKQNFKIVHNQEKPNLRKCLENLD